MEMTEETKEFIGYAVEAAKNIRGITSLLTGFDLPEDGSLFFTVYCNIFDMLQVFLSPLVGKEMHSDELDNMTTEILYAEKGQIGSIIEKYCGAGR